MADPNKDPFENWYYCGDCQVLHPLGKHKEGKPPGPDSSQRFFTSGGPQKSPPAGFYSASVPQAWAEKPPKTVDELLAGWATPAGKRPEPELSAERRSHVARWAAEFKEWQAQGFSRQEAFQLVGLELQLEFQWKLRGGGS